MKTTSSSPSLNILFLALIALLHFNLLSGQRNYPPEISCDTVLVYKTVDNIDLKLWIFNPPGNKSIKQVPAIVFYFGGGWNAGSPEQFVKHCEYLSARGFVAMVADYRVKSRNNVKANKCVSDAKSAIRWIREHAGELGIDPNRIAAGGGSAGGHLAAATATLAKFDDPDENLNISSKPNALVLFNPALVLASIGEVNPINEEKLKNQELRLGAVPEEMSPYHNILPGMAPTIIFHGTNDTTVPFRSAEIFTNKMKKVGNKCTLMAYENEGHGFFNYGIRDNSTYVSTIALVDKFFVEMKWLNALPEPIKL